MGLDTVASDIFFSCVFQNIRFGIFRLCSSSQDMSLRGAHAFREVTIMSLRGVPFYYFIFHLLLMIAYT